MGACDFYVKAKGKNIQEAFNKAVEDAAWEYGHGGYTGSIAEKSSYVLIPYTGKDPERHAERLMRERDKRVDDKWGPAGAIKIGKGEWLFFGMASS
jgi:hypothetical protein